MSTTAGMDGRYQVDLGRPAVIVLNGPDAERFLNGQVTQDVRRLAAGRIALPACVTDAKGRLQFRVWITRGENGGLWVEGPVGLAEEMETRLTRYLIADDVEVENLTGGWRLIHFTAENVGTPPEGVMVRNSSRFGIPGTDWWLPDGVEIEAPEGFSLLEGDELEAFRIRKGAPAWGRELVEGLLVPEAGLDESDVSYHKGCYIGQEVISRIKRVGKTNQRLVRMKLDAAAMIDPAQRTELVDEAGNPTGFLTSVSPIADGAVRAAMGYVKRGAVRFFATATDGTRHEVKVAGTPADS